MFKFLFKPSINNSDNFRKFSTFFKLLSNSQICVEQLKNGVTVVTEEQCSPLTCLSLIIETGPRFENSCNNGVSNFIEHIALSKNDVQESCYNNCIKINAVTTREYQRFSAVCTDIHVSESVEILTKFVTNLEWNDDDMELQKNKIYLEAIDCDNNPKSLVFDYLHQTAFQGTPLGQSVMGPTTNIAKFDKSLICNFMKENYQPHRIILVSSGGESHCSIVDRANSTLGYIMPNECKTFNAGPQRYTGSEVIYRDDSMPFAHVALAVEVPGYNSPEYLPLYVASCLTGSWDRTQGGTNRHGSPLARAASTSKLCEYFKSFYIPYRDVGLWGVYFIGNAKYLDEMVSSIQDQWMHMCITTQYTDIEKAVNMVKLKLAKRVDGVINSCYNIGLQVLYTSERKSLPDPYNEVSKIKEDTIKDVCFKYIYDKCPVVAAVGPTETLPHYNRIRSGMYWVRL
ncbi:cytochrome b-c1 complex subunit 1, mitochondrial-like [Vanessa atalanta]|uniref:cytochrome b-c1 complex subunit 1, mitochondrial-like n=1 Tax=Vanessa atalanta TaxID=42275 RepID=UPI001FCCE17E|nr:cytochrome b-c1 complex subunit 1, mitochondrial-like [Vanessa atalanta]